MRQASVSEVKNGLSGLLQEVRRGEPVLITHHGRPIARIERCGIEGTDAERVAELVRRGVATPPQASLDVERFLAEPLIRLAGGRTVSEAIVAERRGRR